MSTNSAVVGCPSEWGGAIAWRPISSLKITGGSRLRKRLDGRAHRRTESLSVGGGDFCLITDTPIGAVVRHLEAEGGEIISGPGTRAGALGPLTSVYFRDPDGNPVEVSNDPD